MTPPKLLLITTALFLSGGSLLVTAASEPRGLAACIAGFFAGAVAFAMFLTERAAQLELSSEQEQCALSLVREGRKIRAARRVRDAGNSDLKTALRYVHRLERRHHAKRPAGRDLWWA